MWTKLDFVDRSQNGQNDIVDKKIWYIEPRSRRWSRFEKKLEKHKNNLESGSSYAKLEASPAVAKAKFRYVIYWKSKFCGLCGLRAQLLTYFNMFFFPREEWMKIFPWVRKDQSGNPGLAFCTVRYIYLFGIFFLEYFCS